MAVPVRSGSSSPCSSPRGDEDRGYKDPLSHLVEEAPTFSYSGNRLATFKPILGFGGEKSGVYYRKDGRLEAVHCHGQDGDVTLAAISAIQTGDFAQVAALADRIRFCGISVGSTVREVRREDRAFVEQHSANCHRLAERVLNLLERACSSDSAQTAVALLASPGAQATLEGTPHYTDHVREALEPVEARAPLRVPTPPPPDAPAKEEAEHVFVSVEGGAAVPLKAASLEG